jgi:UDP-GlcNAc:undecaprenyl-phosphate GlcNAc-1-phosphate transferase
MIGFVISILGIKSLGYIEPISILYIASVPIIDSLFVILQRILSRSPIFRADKNFIMESLKGSKALNGRLTEYNQVLLTPHMSTYSVQCRKEMEMEARSYSRTHVTCGFTYK